MPLIEDRDYRFNAFRIWLRENTRLGERPIGDVISRVKRVERALPEMIGGSNLDAEYVRDGLSSVLEALTYSIEDVYNHRPPPAGIVFRIAADDPRYYEKIREGLSSLRNAVGLYRDFCDDANPR
jgi:hypothetical protein